MGAFALLSLAACWANVNCFHGLITPVSGAWRKPGNQRPVLELIYSLGA